jgi:hypothetical protein
MTSSASAASPLEALKAGFRRACVRRLVGDEPGAVQVLKNEIPGLVVAWAKTNSSDPSEKKAKLKEMFDDESSRADELSVAFDLFAGRFETRVAEMVRDEVGSITKRIEQMGSRLNSAIENVESLANNLLEIGSSLSSGGRAGHNEKEGALAVHKDSLELPKKDVDGTPGDAMGQIVMDETLNEVALSAENDTDPDPTDLLSENQLKDLDPPSGTGLRFDEIEEMIDEILSYESN